MTPKRIAIVVAAVVVTACASQARTVPASAGAPAGDVGIGYDAAEAAFEGLMQKSVARVGYVQDWTIIVDRESDHVWALWSFTPRRHPAHPAVIKMTLVEDGNEVRGESSMACGASPEVCDTLVRDYRDMGQALQQKLVQGMRMLQLQRGRWGWSNTDDCSRNPHAMSFSNDGEVMTVAYGVIGYVQAGEAREKAIYDVLEYGTGAIRMRLREESRLDEQGHPVVWYLVSIDENSYCWRREDWPEGQCTGRILRCGS